LRTGEGAVPRRRGRVAEGLGGKVRDGEGLDGGAAGAGDTARLESRFGGESRGTSDVVAGEGVDGGRGYDPGEAEELQETHGYWLNERQRCVSEKDRQVDHSPDSKEKKK
jgi:hypothetical protein